MNAKSVAEVLKAGDYVSYIIGEGSNTSNGEFTMSVEDTGNIEDQTYNVTNYGGTWRVLYDYESDGRVEIISSENILIDDNLKVLGFEGKDGYNNFVKTLNKVSGYYLNTEYADKARSVGSNPTNPDGTSEYYKSEFSYMEQYNDLIANEVNLVDYTAMQKLGIVTSSSSYWYANGITSAGTDSTFFGGMYIYGKEESPALGEEKNYSHFLDIDSNGNAQTNNECHGIRPVITLKPNIKAIDSGERIDGHIIWNLVPSN